MNVAFPLRDGYFRPLQATPEDKARWTQRVREHVQLSLREERPYFLSGYEDIDRRKWKLVRRKDQLRVFRPRRDRVDEEENGRPLVGSNLPCLLEIGTIEGTLEDVIYGVHNNSTHDMRTTTSFLSADALDSAVLEVFENGCEDDFYRSFALKWRILETPAGSLVKNRDVLAFEYMGISRDADGERFAFHICDSFDHPVCPPFHPQCSVRAKTHTRIIYRQLRPGRVGVYYRAEYTSGGKIPSLLARWTAAEVAVSIGRSVECAEAKKLTAIALAVNSSDEVKKNPSQRRRGQSEARSCAICDQHISKTVHVCNVCGSTVCNKCRTRKFLLSDEGKMQVSCCKQCIVAAKNMRVDARQPLGIISGAYWRGYGAIVSANAPPPQSGAQRDVFDAPGSISTTSTEDLSVRSRAWTLEQDLDTPQSQRSASTRHMYDRQRSREDVYELMAAMSSTSESTAESIISRDDRSTHTSDSLFDDSPRSEVKRKAMAVVPAVLAPSQTSGLPPKPSWQEKPSTDDAAMLWRRMNELRVAAEQTYRMAKQNSEHWAHREAS